MSHGRPLTTGDPHPMDTPFRDRRHAGQVLARHLGAHADQPGTIVLGLPRGGVPVAWEVARALRAPLDVTVVRKLGLPGHEEYAMGAIAAGGVRVMTGAAADRGVSAAAIDAVVARETAELARREAAYRAGRPPPALAGRTVILVDDGLATGATMRAAVRAVRAQAPARIIVAVPVGAQSSCAELESEADEVVCAMTPEYFHAVGQWYDDFEATEDDEVRALLAAP